jgi:hypothetical protein
MLAQNYSAYQLIIEKKYSAIDKINVFTMRRQPYILIADLDAKNGKVVETARFLHDFSRNSNIL